MLPNTTVQVEIQGLTETPLRWMLSQMPRQRETCQALSTWVLTFLRSPRPLRTRTTRCSTCKCKEREDLVDLSAALAVIILIDWNYVKLRKIGSVKLVYLLGAVVERSAVRLRSRIP
ncbi:hypothetical protein B0H11DRAFT_1898635 [Mycena galericulata]|nr:hypothetical protein B0H11DRAFT_1919329 [Mycena galericulata]KAJ7512132.1 hypothetical protein B0H11DRAFT_1898635 [Mycena galericulata]